MSRALGVVLALLCLSRVVWAESVSSLEQRAKAFYELIEHGDKSRAAAVFLDLERDLVDAEKRLQDELDELRADVGDDDEHGTVAQQPQWKEVQVRGLLISYHLAWVRYQGAQLVDEGQKTALLRKSIEDFSRFVGLDDIKEIAAEAEYGQGLAFMDLGDWPKATEHLQAAAKQAKLAARAKAALAEVKRRAAGGKPDQPESAPEPEKPPDITPETLLTDLKTLLPKAATGDAAAEKRATELARGLAARGGTWPTQIADAVTSTLGAGTAATVRSTYGVYLLAQLALDRNRCADIAPLVAISNALHDAGRSRYHSEVLFMDGGCKLNAAAPPSRPGVASPRRINSAAVRLRLLRPWVAKDCRMRCRSSGKSMVVLITAS